MNVVCESCLRVDRQVYKKDEERKIEEITENDEKEEMTCEEL